MPQIRYLLLMAMLPFVSSCVQMNKADDGPLNKVDAQKINNEQEINSLGDNLDENFLRSINEFIPENYSVLDTAGGDVNLDNIPDLLLVLRNNGEDTLSNVADHPKKRPLLILLRDSTNKFNLARRNDNTVLCVDCGGIMGDPFMEIKINGGQFSVAHYGGSNWRWTRLITYSYSIPEQDWFLFEDKTENFHTSDPEKVETTIKTSKDFGKLKFVDVDIYKDQ